jgi:hypothetical protein
MSDFDRLKARQEKEILALQKRCPHKKTEWMDEWWALGHSTGRRVRCCLNCNKKVEIKEPVYLTEEEYAKQQKIKKKR